MLRILPHQLRLLRFKFFTEPLDLILIVILDTLQVVIQVVLPLGRQLVVVHSQKSQPRFVFFADLSLPHFRFDEDPFRDEDIPP